MLKYAVVCLLIVACATADPVRRSGSRKGKSGLPGCNPMWLMNATQCCSTVPKAVSLEDVQPCLPTDKSTKPDHLCIANCTLKRAGYALEEGGIDYTKLTNAYLAKATTDEWKSQVNTAVETCKALVDEKKAQIQGKAPKKSQCTPDATWLLICIQSKLIKVCPEADKVNLVDSNPECSVRLNHLSNCDPFAPPRMGDKKKRGRSGPRG